MDVQKILRNELEKAKPNWVEEITEGVSKIVTEKFDKVMTVLDKFVGEVDSYRKVQELTGQTLSEHSDMFEKIDKRLKRLEHPVL
jgi:hypothetical protein